jgi:hypothetical protein
MIKRINSLGRKRIPSTSISIAVRDGDPRRFSASIDLPENGWPGDAIVVMEAMCAGSPNVKRIDCGTVNRLSVPQDSPLDGITGKNVFFSLKVIDRSEKIGRLLGIADNLRPTQTGKQTEAGRRGILPVEAKSLGQRLWQLEFREQDVFLLVNQDVPGLHERMRSDPLIYSLVYPEVIRRVMSKAIDENVDLDDDDDRWQTLWLKFGRNLHPARENPPSAQEEEDIEEWIDQVITGFCQIHGLRDRFASALKGSGSDD